jgi:hypothetical protein
MRPGARRTSCAQDACVSHAVAVSPLALLHVHDGVEAAVRVQRRAWKLARRIVHGPELVEEQELAPAGTGRVQVLGVEQGGRSATRTGSVCSSLSSGPPARKRQPRCVRGHAQRARARWQPTRAGSALVREGAPHRTPRTYGPSYDEAAALSVFFSLEALEHALVGRHCSSSGRARAREQAPRGRGRGARGTQ